MEADLAKAGVTKDQSLFVQVLTPEEEAKLEDLRAAIQEGLDSGPGWDGEEIFAELRAELLEKHPELEKYAQDA